MLYLIGGVAKSGKSLLSRLILQEKHIPTFRTDYLMVGLSDTIPGFTIHPDTDRDELVANKLYPILKKMMTVMLHNQEDYVIEGVHIRPKLMKELSDLFPNQVKSVCLVYDQIPTEVKRKELEEHVLAKHRTWLDAFQGDRLDEVIEVLKEESKELKQECIVYHIPYVEVENIEVQKETLLEFLFAE